MTQASILIVDDVEANLIALEATLAHLPCSIVRASSGNAALKELLRRDFAVMLLDVQMPDMDGYEVAQYARGNSTTAHVPIIFLTALHETEEARHRGYGSGAVDYVFKPIDPHILESKIRVFLDLHEERRRLAEEVQSHKTTMKELERANEALRHFNHAASHDLREPMRVATGFLKALEKDPNQQLDDRGRHYVTRAAEACKRMSSLLESLLAYARLQKSGPERPIETKVVAERAAGDLAERIEKVGATVTIEDLPIVQGDDDRVYQLFLNLIGNAIKFAPPGQAPAVRVSAETQAGKVKVTVADNGIGIAPEHQEAIFSAFHRLHGHSEYEGSGLGLAICRQIVEQLGGRIWVDSEPGKGSRFSFELKA